MKRIYRSILLLAAALPAAFPTEAREIIDINRNWRFTLDDNRTYGEPAFDDSGSQRLDLPHDWSIAGAYDKRNPSGPQGGFMPCGTGWYSHSFEAPAGSDGNRVFVRFDGVVALELMRRTDIRDSDEGEHTGFCHVAFGVGSREAVCSLTERLRRDGYRIAGEPRQTGDGYFESVVCDPDGNRIEIVA